MSRINAFATVLPAALVLHLAAPLAAQEQSGMHPKVQLRDSTGASVLASGGALSLERTCGECHDARFIVSHNGHADAWRRRLWSVATLTSSRPGPDEAEDEPEMNCLLCHLPDPADEEWITAIRRGQASWAAAASLAHTAVVERVGDRWRWNANAFDESGTVGEAELAIVGPSIDNCARCHGIAGSGMDQPVTLGGLGPGTLMTLTTGEIISPQRIAASGVNLRDKQALSRSWDVHAERLLDCTDCHHSANNPAYCRQASENQPEGLMFDGRRVPLHVYLKQPDHNLTGQSGSCGGRETCFSCDKCHDPQPTHTWLPYAERHFAKLTCQACHSPKLHSVAVASVDWTTPSADGSPRVTYRGFEGTDSVITAEHLVEGFEPVLLLRRGPDGDARLAPYNLVTSWYWVAGDPLQPIPLDGLRTAAGTDDRARDSEATVSAMRQRLEAAGFEEPRVVGEILPYAVNHTTARGGWATRDCESCHRSASRISQPMVLSAAAPAGVTPVVLERAGSQSIGRAVVDDNGRLLYQPVSREAGLYVLGHDAVRWANVIGLLAVLAALLGVATHTVLRWMAARRGVAGAPHAGEPVYMYSAYERFWHWLQSLAILILLVTGLEIHFSAVSLLGFALAVRVHNIVGFIVAANAVFAAFYHLASGEIQHYLPEPAGFFGQAIAQLRYYLGGIFHGEAHPFQKRPDRKLNPLQQLTYLSILNLLLPLQIVTGVLIWGAQRWAAVDAALGGLTVLAPIHALGAWLFAAFLLLHLYLTTTGPTPTAHIGAMLHGWDRAGPAEAREQS
jgi:thiosulfate reductase cytochrome b subunit